MTAALTPHQLQQLIADAHTHRHSVLLAGRNLEDATLPHATLARASLQGTRLARADLRGVYLGICGIDRTDLSKARR